MIKKFSKYNSSFDYFDKSLIVLSVTTGSIFIASLETVIGAPVGIACASFSLAFSISMGIVNFLKKKQREIKRKSIIKFLYLARSKLNGIESKISEALINNEISHEDFMLIINEEKTIVNFKKALE